MISLRRLSLALLVGVLLVAGLTVTFASSPSTVLRSDVPDIEPQPANTAERYSAAWFTAEAKVEVWRQKYPEPVLIVFPRAVDRPVYNLSGDGAASAFAIIPRYRLTVYADAIRAGDVQWCFLADAFVALSSPPPTSDKATAEALQASRATITQAIAILSQP